MPWLRRRFGWLVPLLASAAIVWLLLQPKQPGPIAGGGAAPAVTPTLLPTFVVPPSATPSARTGAGGEATTLTHAATAATSPHARGVMETLEGSW